MNLGERLKAVREQKGLRQNYVAAKIGVSPSTLAGYESGFRKPDIEMIAKMATVYDLSIDYLVSGKTTKVSDEVYELRNMLNEANLQLDGVPLSKSDKKQIEDVLTGLFWDTVGKKAQSVEKTPVRSRQGQKAGNNAQQNPEDFGDNIE